MDFWYEVSLFVFETSEVCSLTSIVERVIPAGQLLSFPNFAFLCLEVLQNSRGFFFALSLPNG